MLPPKQFSIDLQSMKVLRLAKATLYDFVIVVAVVDPQMTRQELQWWEVGDKKGCAYGDLWQSG